MIATIFAALLALSSLVALAAPAAAQVSNALQAMPALKGSAMVTSSLVHIGDLVDNAGAVADVPIFRSPDIGTTGSVPVARVLAAIRSHNIFAIHTGDLTEVEVTRLGRTITAAEIEARVLRAFAGQYGLGDAANLVMTFDNDLRAMVVEPTVTAELQVARARFEKRTGRFEIAFDLPGSAIARRTPLRYTGTLTQLVAAAVLTRSLMRGEMVKAVDVAIERRAKSEVASDVAGPNDPVVGLSARQALHAGQLLRRADLVKPEIVKRGETVTLVYEMPGILLTTRGKAIESGAEGDLVSVLNPQTKRTVQGSVSGAGRVTVMSATPHVVTAAAAVERTEPSEQARPRSE